MIRHQRIQVQEPEGRNQSKDHGEVLLISLLPPGLLSLLSYNFHDCWPRGGITHNGLGPVHQSLIEKMHHILAYSPIPWKHLLHWEALFPNGSSLCQVYWQLAGMPPWPPRIYRGSENQILLQSSHLVGKCFNPWVISTNPTTSVKWPLVCADALYPDSPEFPLFILQSHEVDWKV